jgi:hypothetical protein
MRFVFVRCAYVGAELIGLVDRLEVLLHRLNLAIAHGKEEMLSEATNAVVICAWLNRSVLRPAGAAYCAPRPILRSGLSPALRLSAVPCAVLRKSDRLAQAAARSTREDVHS